VEVIIAIGIFAFCIVGIVYLLGSALSSSRESQRDSALRSILQNTEAEMASLPASILTNLTSTNFDFDLSGALTTVPTNGAYRVVVSRVSAAAVTGLTKVMNGTNISPGVTNADNHFLWVLRVSYPPPDYPQTNTLMIGRALMGSGTSNFRE